MSRSRAADVISKAIAPIGVDYNLFPTYTGMNISGPANWLAFDNKRTCEALATQGYVALQTSPEAITVTLTDKGREVFTNNDAGYAGRQSWKTAACRMELVSVTGISKTSENTAVVQYTWKWHLTPVGSIAWKSVPELAGQDPDATFTTQAALQRFDDGWRIAN
ncbi:MAG TPA: hypothetical protein VG944_05550 [Fimbriimonas sp.]|nr:hypothetical protein [Fimbriimonas sp.]